MRHPYERLGKRRKIHIFALPEEQSPGDILNGKRFLALSRLGIWKITDTGSKRTNVHLSVYAALMRYTVQRGGCRVILCRVVQNL